LPILEYYNSVGERVAVNGSARAKRALVEIVPNGVTGSSFHVDSHDGADFTVLDIVFQVGGSTANIYGGEISRKAASSLDYRIGCLMLTASKDLSVPAIRAGLLVTKNPDLRAFLARDRFERTFSLNLQSSQTVLAYLAVLDLYRALPEQKTTYSELRKLFADASSGALPSQADCQRILMRSRYQENLEVIEGHLRNIGGQILSHPESGYSLFSVFPDLGISSQADFVKWCNWVGRSKRLKLNPTVLFGGDATTWEALYPATCYIRMNTSVPRQTLLDDLGLLVNAISDSRSTLNATRRPSSLGGAPSEGSRSFLTPVQRSEGGRLPPAADYYGLRY
jgi:hypothetical protein